jgi:hypothetical protein
MLSGWEDPAQADQSIEWTRDVYAAMRPSLHDGMYVNAVGADSVSDVRAAYRAENVSATDSAQTQIRPNEFLPSESEYRPWSMTQAPIMSTGGISGFGTR